jgi:uncharacterized membrane protein
VFFTRWITHFCAPAFIFLAGTAAFLHGQKLGDKRALSRFLLTRGLWLLFIEMTVVRLGWTFNLDYANYMLAGVIWVIGWCMILMSALVFLPAAVVGSLGVAIIGLHNLLDPYVGAMWQAAGSSSYGWLLQVLYLGGEVRIGGDGGPPLAILYVIVPWIGVMAAGYGFGLVMRAEPARRRRRCLTIGLGATALFIGLRGIDRYGDPRPWSPAHQPAASAQAATASPAQPAAAPPRISGALAVFAFLNTAKYPASLLFLLMTLGPTIAFIPVLEKARGAWARVLTVFGRVPFLYYVLHIPLIHALACVVSVIRTGSVNPWLMGNHPMNPPELPDGYMWSLGLLYLVWAVAVALLYFPCRWFADLRARRREKWLSYL